MKLAVVGGGSTYTPELVDGFARLRDTLPVERAGAGRPGRRPAGAGRRARPGGSSPAQGHPGRIVTDRPTSTRASTAPTPCCSSCGSAARPPATRTRPGRWSAAASGRRPPAPAAWPRRCAPCRSCSTSPSGSRRRNPDAWIVDFTNPVGIVTRALLQAGHRAVGLCNVAIGFQRRFAGLLGVDARPGRARPRRAQPPDLGARRARVGRRGRAARAARPSTATRSPTTSSCPRALLRPARRRPVVLPALLLRPRRGRRASSGPSRRGPPRWPRSSASCCEMYADPALDDEARAAGAARRRVLLRGGGGSWSRRCSATAAAGDAGGQPAQRRHAAVPARRRRDRGAGRGRRARAPTPLPVAPLDPLYAGLVAHVTAYEDLALDAALHGGRERVFEALLAHPLVGQVDLADGLTDRLIAHNREHLAWA